MMMIMIIIIIIIIITITKNFTFYIFGTLNEFLVRFRTLFESPAN
jgi:hypothetical protein